jgi:DNA-binding MarR family transcriptional regulator
VTKLSDQLLKRAAIHAALGEPARLAIIDELSFSDRSPRDLGSRLQIPSNLLAHHLDTLENIGLILRSTSSGDARRRYIRLDPSSLHLIAPRRSSPRKPLFFLCTQNSARSQLAAAIWQTQTGQPAKSAGTQPASQIHRQAISAAKRHKIELNDKSRGMSKSSRCVTWSMKNYVHLLIGGTGQSPTQCRAEMPRHLTQSLPNSKDV